MICNLTVEKYINIDEVFKRVYIIFGGRKHSNNGNGNPSGNNGHNNTSMQNSKPWLENYRLFTAREYEPELDLYYYRSRYYDAKIGKFTSRDPLLYIDGPNPYTYVNNNPVNYVDPWGLSSKDLYPDITSEFTELLKKSAIDMEAQYEKQKNSSILNYGKNIWDKYIYFKNKVQLHGDWDFKQEESEFGQKKYPQDQFQIGESIVGRDFMGNMNYGYAGTAGGIPKVFVISMSPVAQIIHDYTPLLGKKEWEKPTKQSLKSLVENEYKDVKEVVKGVLLYENHKGNINETIVSHYVESSIPSLLKETYNNKVNEIKGYLNNSINNIKNSISNQINKVKNIFRW